MSKKTEQQSEYTVQKKTKANISPPLLEIRGMCFSSNGKDILHNINLLVRNEDFIAIVGPNGGGKSTLLKVMLGLLTPSRGTVRINGHDPRRHQASIGYVPQYVNNNLSFPATALDVVLMGLHTPERRFTWRKASDKRKAALEALEKLGVADFAHRKIVSLSGGERQRVLIARALVDTPDLLILDEPTASIDTKGQTELYSLLQELNKEVTIIMVSHDLMVISSYAKSIICLNKRMHYHQAFHSSTELLEAFYSCSVEEACPVQMVAELHARKPVIKRQTEQGENNA